MQESNFIIPVPLKYQFGGKRMSDLNGKIAIVTGASRQDRQSCQRTRILQKDCTNSVKGWSEVGEPEYCCLERRYNRDTLEAIPHQHQQILCKELKI